MPVEIGRSQFLYVGAPPTCIVCRNWESNFSMLGPIPNFHCLYKLGIQFHYVGAPDFNWKSLLQAKFCSVNYY
ncbi:hypothetical protein SAOV_0812 [Staphylococcus aureus subsp. aureus ED133]|nr:hypothetical protein SAOV_0812 [Staphylococcus aureus subsp. aureus ED133]AXU07950.1 Hypothetical protein SaO17_00761 [Staphylococcus aureus]